MTRYEEIADLMVRDYKELIKLVEGNNGKIPSKELGKKYNADPSACRELFIGIKAVYNHVSL